jgi:hypothetical protein
MERFFLFCITSLILTINSPIAPQEKSFTDQNYDKKEYQIPMRDGVKLFTAVYSPKDKTRDYPIILVRTPYSVAPYGEDNYRRTFISENLDTSKFIFAFQDVRGKFMSEGEFVNMRPYIPNKKGNQVDEASDTYDTIEWLINNVPDNNHKVGMTGISYPGFYAAQGVLSGHPALKFVSPQAPIADWFIGDDMHHNGAFSLLLSFNFFQRFGIVREGLYKNWKRGPNYPSQDAYSFFLELGPIKNTNEKYLKEEIPFWNEIFRHGNYYEFWRSKSTLDDFKKVSTSVMTVGGWYDGEDLFGALETYSTIEENNPDKFNILVMGPWIHGGWLRTKGDELGHFNFDSETSKYFQDSIHFPLFNYYLKDGEKPDLAEAYIFDTGSNEWFQFSEWPLKNLKETELYLSGENKLQFHSDFGSQKFDEFISDPMNPVPYTAKRRDSRRFYNKNYLIEDQRFASFRPDVLSYETEVLSENMTIAGPITAELFISTTGTDADWVVKIIDVYPDSAQTPRDLIGETEMGGYQRLVRYEIMRGKYRNSYEKPEPFKPGKVTKVKFELPDVMHTFKKGHKIMIQIQSSMFPLYDRNPQTFCDIYSAGKEDFQQAVHRVYFSEKYPSKIIFGEYKAE